MSFTWILPFVLLLLSMAVLPLMVPHFWERNLNKGFITLALGIPTAIYLLLHHPGNLVHSLHEYLAFIILLGSLFIISGGIFVSGDLQATPKINTTFLALGAILANLIGTTGASMLLIRPYLSTNRERRHVAHLPIFFIFIVSNMGGALTPIGDPPLFLGFLKGVPFFWTLHLIPMWAVANGLVLFIFYFWDRRCYLRETKKDLLADIKQIEPLKIHGSINLILLAGVVLGVFLPSPFRETNMILMAVLSLIITPKKIRTENKFIYHPIIEVAILFAGIFITMVPALELLKMNGAAFNMSEPHQFFWATGFLSSFLDNAPTYLAFFSLAQGLNLGGVAGIPEPILAAISCGAVFMGAMTYIGNGPNFMVKAIADKAGIKTPSFFGYMGYSVGILVPIFFLIEFLFFR